MKNIIDLYQYTENLIIFLDKDFNIIDMNKSALDLYDLGKKDIQGKNYFALHRQYHMPCPFEKNMPIPPENKVEVRIKKQNQNERLILWDIKSFNTNLTEKIDYIIDGKDVTELRCAEEKIFELDSIIAQIPGNIYWHTAEGIYLGSNNGNANLMSRKREDIIGLNAYDILKNVLSPDMLKNIMEHDKTVIETGIPQVNKQIEPFYNDKGKLTYFLSNKIPLYDSKKRSIGLLGISIDITDLAETRQKLELAQQRAELSSKAKSEFIANMSHDLRTPMHGVLGMQDLVLMAVDKAKVIFDDKETSAQQLRDMISEFFHNVERYAKTAKHSTEQLIELFNQILESVSLDEGGVEETSKVFNLSDLIERNVLLLQSAAMHKKLELTYGIDERVPEYVCGLPIYLDRCIGNLLSNALKFTHQGSIHIDVGLSEQLDGVSANSSLNKSFTLVIKVCDTGIGIAEDKRKEIFKPFTRLTNSFDGVYKGSGLGLATVKQYVEKMQGTIELESELGQGTTFMIQIPVTVADAIPEQGSGNDKSHTALNPNLIEREAIDMQNRIAPIKNVRRRLLVVEDNEPAAVFAQACLSSDTCLVDIAGSGGEALELVQRNHYHLIFMDIGLPDIAGIEVIRRIRQLADTQKGSVPIVALTGHAFSKEKRQTFFAMGVSGVLSKPASESELKSMVEQCARGGGIGH